VFFFVWNLGTTRRDEEEGEDEQNDEDNKIETTSDEGIDDTGSETGTAQNDYLISTVSKADLELLSK